MKKCPFCAEEIQDEAIKCKHCGEMLAPPLPNDMLSSSETLTGEPVGMDMAKVFVVAVAGTIALFVGVYFWDDLKLRASKAEPAPSAPVAQSAETPTTLPKGWCKPSTRFWTGLELYSGTPEIGIVEKWAVVVGGDSKDVLVRFLDGNLEWKDRRTLASADWSWCRCDDPAIKAERWRVIHME